MATVRTRGSQPLHRPESVESAPTDPWYLRAVDALFHFLASLRLAVMLISTLAAVLGYATFYESSQGTQAVQSDIYQSAWFALLLAMLGVNILCAALIRYPWKKRQTGFVVTHAGLIVLLIGAFLSIQLADEGHVVIPEGTSTEEFYRSDRPVFRVEKYDRTSTEPRYRAAIGFRPGGQPWRSEELKEQSQSPEFVRNRTAERMVWGGAALVLWMGALFLSVRARKFVSRPLGALVLTLFLGGGLMSAASAYYTRIQPIQQQLSDGKGPFKLVMTDYIPNAQGPIEIHEPASNGKPMARVSLTIQPPNAPETSPPLPGNGWLVPREPLGTASTNLESLVRFEIRAIRGNRAAEDLDDFLTLPPHPTQQALARLHYTDNQGKRRVYDWLIEQPDPSAESPAGEKTRTLPDSDISATLLGERQFNAAQLRQLPDSADSSLIASVLEATGRTELGLVLFHVQRGEGAPVLHLGFANLAAGPSVIPSSELNGALPEEIVHIGFYQPPELRGRGGMAMGGRGVLSQIDLAITEEGRLYCRSFGLQQVFAPAEVSRGEVVELVGGAGSAITLKLKIDEILKSGGTRITYKVLPAENDSSRANPVVKLDFSAEGESRSFWLEQSKAKTFEFQDNLWRVQFDMDRGKLPLNITLVDFEPSNDPGTTSRSAYRSDVVVRELGSSPESPVPFSDLKSGGYFTFLDNPSEAFRKSGADTYHPFDKGTSENETLAQLDAQVQPIPRPEKITMNNPMDRAGWTFFQSRFDTVTDPSGRPTGKFRSILSVRKDPAWPVVYGGCLLIVLGTFVQFYMRAGVFTDGGKRERELAARKNKAKPGATGEAVESPEVEALPELDL